MKSYCELWLAACRLPECPPLLASHQSGLAVYQGRTITAGPSSASRHRQFDSLMSARSQSHLDLCAALQRAGLRVLRTRYSSVDGTEKGNTAQMDRGSNPQSPQRLTARDSTSGRSTIIHRTRGAFEQQAQMSQSPSAVSIALISTETSRPLLQRTGPYNER